MSGRIHRMVNTAGLLEGRIGDGDVEEAFITYFLNFCVV